MERAGEGEGEQACEHGCRGRQLPQAQPAEQGGERDQDAGRARQHIQRASASQELLLRLLPVCVVVRRATGRSKQSCSSQRHPAAQRPRAERPRPAVASHSADKTQPEQRCESLRKTCAAHCPSSDRGVPHALNSSEVRAAERGRAVSKPLERAGHHPRAAPRGAEEDEDADLRRDPERGEQCKRLH
eukprot:3626898-Rhodomonas_salina.1